MFKRFRRLRINENLRNLLTQTRLDVFDFMYPLFAKAGTNIKTEITSMPGVFQMSPDEIVKECGKLKELGLKSIMLFGIPKIKDSIGSDALCDHGIIATTIKEIKKIHPDMFITSDLCFCEYTDHGHCGILDLDIERV